MNTQEAHTIANTEIIIRIKELKKLKKNGVSDTSFSVIEKKEFIKGILIAQEKEVEFLTSEFFIYLAIDNKYQTIKVRKRLEALKISCEDLRRVLK